MNEKGQDVCKYYGGITCTVYWNMTDDGRKRINGKMFEKDGRRAYLDILPGYMPYGRENAYLVRYREDGSSTTAAFKHKGNAEQKAIEWVQGK